MPEAKSTRRVSSWLLKYEVVSTQMMSGIAAIRDSVM
jgi:hypothetical protein